MLTTLRKFGLECCDLPTMLWNLTVLWRVLALNIDKRYTKGIAVGYKIFATVIFISCIYVYVVSMVWFVFVKCSETGDIIAAMVVFSLGISSQIGTCKLIVIVLNKEKIRDLVEAYFNSDSIEIPISRFSTNILKTLRVVKKRAIAFWLVIIVNGIVYWLKPILMPGRHLMEDSFIYFGLEPMFESPNYEIALCLTTCGVMFTVYSTANITAFLIVIAGYTEAQLLALSEEIKYLWEDGANFAKSRTIIIDNEAKRNILMNKYTERELAKIVKKHAINIDLIRKTENIFRGAIAAEFIILTVALIAELLGGLENTYLQMPFALMQVAMDCLVGQRMMDANIVFENAVYDSKWENFDKANMRTVQLILINAQKTLTLSAGGVTMLSFTSLMFILKSIYSTYTTLRSTVK